MTEENIKRMALESGFSDGEVDYIQSIIIHFATLVAQQEREACAILCEESPDVGHVGNKLTPDFHSYLIRKRGQA
jgi:hypothetical protein